MKHALAIIMLTIIVAVDQVTKTYVLMGTVDDIQISQFLNIVHAWNEGISFGLFSGDNSNVILMFITGIIALIFTILLLKTEKQIMSIAYAFVVGGALGNLIDRIRYRAVFDFIDLHMENFHWPTFNVADAFICVGGVILFWNILFDNKMLVIK